MYRKLALRNVRRSVRDYAIYFVTLLMGVAIFYAFNSIGSQEILFDLESNASQRQFETISMFIGLFSGVVAFVLGFLILYANRFLIKRRKREFGTYLLLGMSPGTVSRIVLLETAVVGVASLAVGLVAGFLLSQAFSFFTAALFQIPMTHYQFVFSFDALLATLGCFALIYVVVAAFNVLTVSRCRLIDLLRANERNEKAGVRNPWVCLGAFVVSIGILAFAYQQLIESGFVMLDDPRLTTATVGMLVGTLLLFWSLAGFLIGVISHAPGVYLRKLRVFTVRQFASKVNTAFVSLWAVTVLLFFGITTFSCGMGMADIFSANVVEANPYDASLTAVVWYGPDGGKEASAGAEHRREEMKAEAPDRLALAESNGWDMARALRANAPEEWEQTVGASAQVDEYQLPGQTYRAILKEAGASDEELSQVEESLGSAVRQEASVISVSQANGLLALQGREPVTLPAGACLLANNMDVTKPLEEIMRARDVTIEAAGARLAMEPDVLDLQLEDNVLPATGLVFVVPDAVVESLADQGLIPSLSILDIMYADNGKSAVENGRDLAQIIAASQPLSQPGFEKGTAGANDVYSSYLWPVTRMIAAQDMIDQASGLRVMITYLALYIGFVLLVSVAAMLAIQQLSETTDSLGRYRTLWKLGCDRSMISRSLAAQVGLYFLAPLAVAICHSACAIMTITDSLFQAVGLSPLGATLMSVALLVVVYGGYLLVTYLASRSMVLRSLQERA